MTGTSMSSPLVAGIAATILAVDNTPYNTTTMCQKLINTATPNMIQNLNDPDFSSVGLGPNLVAYNGNGA
jgi:subtilisin family serine protease